MYPVKTKKKYDPSNLASTWNIFTTVYLGNYISGNFDEGAGSHLGVDVFPITTHDNVVACLPGIIDVAGTKDANGNYIIIKHEKAIDPNDKSKTTTLYSCHLHLSELLVQKGDIVKEGDIIGKTGNTGNVSGSTGEHLHFQIDTKDAPFHPYWPFTFAESKEAGLGFFDAVNKGLGIDNARKFTINPLVYLDSINKGFGTIPSGTDEEYKGIESLNTLVADSSSSTADAGINNNITNNIITNNISSTTTSTTIPDTKKTSYFKDTNEESINYLAEAGVTKGYSDGTFRPETEISRAELLAMVFTFSKMPVSNNTNTPFTDVLPTDWFYRYVGTASSKGIINGYPDNTFRPNNPITKAEAIAIILNMILGKDKISDLSGSLFTDIQSGIWYEKYVYYVAQNGLLNIDGNKFYPDKNIKRKEVAEILYNLRSEI